MAFYKTFVQTIKSNPQRGDSKVVSQWQNQYRWPKPHQFRGRTWSYDKVISRRKGLCLLTSVNWYIGAVDIEEEKNINFECMSVGEHYSFDNAIECGID